MLWKTATKSVWSDAPSKHSGWQTNCHQHCPRTKIKGIESRCNIIAAVVVTARRLLVLYWTSTGLHLFSSSYIMDYVRFFCALYRHACNCFPQIIWWTMCVCCVYYDAYKVQPRCFLPFFCVPILVPKWKTAQNKLDHIINYDLDRYYCRWSYQKLVIIERICNIDSLVRCMLPDGKCVYLLIVYW